MPLNTFQMMQLAGNSLSVQRTRLDVVSANLANAQTTRTPDGGPYKKRSVYLEEQALRDRFGNELSEAMQSGVKGVAVSEIKEDESAPRLEYDPGHPDANEDGYVAYPNVNSMEEMVDMITIMRSYQANLQVFSAAREMAQRALNMGRNS